MLSASDRAWLAARAQGITGTDVAAILGLNRYRNALDVYLEKTGQEPAREQTEAMWWGTYLEEGITRRYAELVNLKRGDLLRGAAIAKAFPKGRVMIFGNGPNAHVLVRHPKYPQLLGTFDGLVPSMLRGLEAKTAGEHMADEWGEPGTDQVPIHYLTQCAQYMACADYPQWDVAVLIGGNQLGLFNVKRNAPLEAEIMDAGLRFHRDHIVKQKPPQIDSGHNWQRYLASKYRKATGRVLTATEHLMELAKQYRTAQQKRQAAEAEEMLARNLWAAELKSADKVRGPFGTVGWVRPTAKPSTDWEALARSLKPSPAQIARHTTTEANPAYVRAWWHKGEETA